MFEWRKTLSVQRKGEEYQEGCQKQSESVEYQSE